MPSLSPEGCDSGPSLLFGTDTEHVAAATFSCQGIHRDPRLVWHYEVLFVVRGYCYDTDVLEAVSIFLRIVGCPAMYQPFTVLIPAPFFPSHGVTTKDVTRCPLRGFIFIHSDPVIFLVPCILVFVCLYVHMLICVWEHVCVCVCVEMSEPVCICMLRL